MSVPKQELIEWLQDLPGDRVAIGDCGISVVEVDETNNSTGNYFEVGGHTPDEEEQ